MTWTQPQPVATVEFTHGDPRPAQAPAPAPPRPPVDWRKREQIAGFILLLLLIANVAAVDAFLLYAARSHL